AGDGPMSRATGSVRAPAPHCAESAERSAVLWWDGPPWHGRIDQAEFVAIIAAYLAAHGHYTPLLPSEEPDVLRAWRAARAPAPRGGEGAEGVLPSQAAAALPPPVTYRAGRCSRCGRTVPQGFRRCGWHRAGGTR